MTTVWTDFEPEAYIKFANHVGDRYEFGASRRVNDDVGALAGRERTDLSVHPGCLGTAAGRHEETIFGHEVRPVLVCIESGQHCQRSPSEQVESVGQFGESEPRATLATHRHSSA